MIHNRWSSHGCIVYANVNFKQLMANFNYSDNDLKENDDVLSISLNEYKQLFYRCIMPTLNEYKDKQLHLIFHALNDGFSASEFHKKCDGKSPTIAIIVSTNNNIYGGFTDIAWETPFFGKYQADTKKSSFIFVTNHDNKELIYMYNVKNDDKHIYCGKNYGPTYGNDLVISSGCDSNENSYWNQGNCYGNESKSKQFFKVQDYYVFTLK